MWCPSRGGNSNGGPTAHPVPADYDGDGRADLALKWDDGRWMVDYASDGFSSAGLVLKGSYYGGPLATPVAADYDGDGRADISVKDSGDGTWLIDYASNGYGVWDCCPSDTRAYGCESSIPVPADYDGNHSADRSVKNAGGEWLIKYSPGGAATGVRYAESPLRPSGLETRAAPNPFGSGTTLFYELPYSTHVSVRVYDVVGRRVADLVDAYEVAGAHSVRWDGLSAGQAVPVGIYFYRITAAQESLTKKIALVR